MDDTGFLKVNIEGRLYERSYADLAFIVGQAEFSLAKVVSKRFGLSIQDSIDIVKLTASYKVWELMNKYEKKNQ